MTSLQKKSALFICLGNICRSTMAEGILRSLIKQRGVASEWQVDSAATGDYNVGLPPDERTTMTLAAHGIKDYKHYARLLTTEDFYTFNYIFVMDNANMRDVMAVKPKDSKSQVLMLGSYDYGNKEIIDDPYFKKGSKHFEPLYDKCLVCCKNFLSEFYSS